MLPENEAHENCGTSSGNGDAERDGVLWAPTRWEDVGACKRTKLREGNDETDRDGLLGWWRCDCVADPSKDDNKTTRDGVHEEAEGLLLV